MMTDLTTISSAELVKLCAVDSELYARTFFPRTFRVPSPSFAQELWQPLEDPRARLVNLLCFRGVGKTTRLRTFASKRIAYGISRTILYIGASERDAIRSVQWLRTQVETNTRRDATADHPAQIGWSDTFGLMPGRKWEETQIEINHRGFGHTVWVLAAGITGSLRGINFDDYRPDLIIVDDPQTEEVAASEEQRNKVVDLILGAVKNSLSREEPNAKLAMAITPQHANDVSQQALKSDQWTTKVFPCWTRETMHLQTDQQISSWEEMFPTPTLRKEKREAIKDNKLSIFTRDMECRLTSPEKAQFRRPWLQVRDYVITPRDGCFAVLGVDPVPPPSDREVAKNLHGKNFEAQYVWGRKNGEYHLLDCERNRGHDPSWSVATAFGLMHKWRCARMVFDATAYQRTLKWLFEQEMRRRGIWFTIIPRTDNRSKFNKIVSTIGSLATNNLLFVGPEHSTFVEQYEQYPDVEFDDDLDASAIALSDLSNPYLEDRGDGSVDNSDVEVLEVAWSAP